MISSKTFSTSQLAVGLEVRPAAPGLGHDLARLVGQQADGLGAAGVDPDARTA